MNIIGKVFKWLFGFLIIILALGLVFIAVKYVSISKKRNDVIHENAISEVREYELGGYKQKVMIEGRSQELPIVIFLHGGPGTPLPLNVGSRGMVPEITNQNIFVTWDQFGSGINNHTLDSSVTMDTIVDMAKNLVVALKKDFPDNRLSLFAVSWGSMLSARLADEIPEMIDEVIVYGQISSHLFMNEEVFEALLESRLPDKDREELMEIMQKERYTDSDVEKMAGWMSRYTEAYFSKGSGPMEYFDFLAGSLFSPDYELSDFRALFHNGYRSSEMEHLVVDLVKLDLRPVLERVSIPYTIFQGEKDLVTSTKAIKEFFDQTENSNLRLEIIPDSAHMPSAKTMEYIFDFDQFRQ